MFQAVFNSETVFVVDDVWDDSTLNADFSLVRDTTGGLTKREARRAFSDALLVPSLTYGVTVLGPALTKLQGSLRALNTQPVIVPLWPAMTRWADRAGAAISGGLLIVWKDDWSQYEIYFSTDAEPGWPAAGDNFAPALKGFLKPGQPNVLNPGMAQWNVLFEESAPVECALLPAALGLTAGPQPAGYAAAPKMLPLNPDFGKVQEQIQVNVGRNSYGFVREKDSEFYAHAAYRSQVASYTLMGDEIGKMLSFFLTTAGPGAAFWAPSWMSAAVLTQDVLAGDTLLHVEDTNGVKVGDYICLWDGQNNIARKIIAPLTADTITVNAAVGAGLLADSACIFPLCLVSLVKPALRMQWLSPGLARCDLQLSEVLPEVLIPGDETLGTTIGQVGDGKRRVVLFKFTRDFGNGTVSNWYYTSFLRDIAYDGHDWLHTGLECGAINQSLNLEDDGLNVTGPIFAGSPLVDEMALRAEARLNITIYFADWDGANATNVETMFTGAVEAMSRDGNILTAECKLGPSLLDTELPPFIHGQMCNHLHGTNTDGSFLVSAGCTLLKADWKFTGLVAAPVSAAFPYALHLSSLTGVGAQAIAAIVANAVFVNWFANGWIEFGAGAAIQRRAIVGSTAPVASALTLSLHRYFTAIPIIGNTVTLFPGCDGVYATCKLFDAALNPTGKFNNPDNFGGSPFRPIANPSTSGPKRNGTQGSKKG